MQTDVLMHHSDDELMHDIKY